MFSGSSCLALLLIFICSFHLSHSINQFRHLLIPYVSRSVNQIPHLLIPLCLIQLINPCTRSWQDSFLPCHGLYAECLEVKRLDVSLRLFKFTFIQTISCICNVGRTLLRPEGLFKRVNMALSSLYTHKVTCLRIHTPFCTVCPSF